MEEEWSRCSMVYSSRQAASGRRGRLRAARAGGRLRAARAGGAAEYGYGNQILTLPLALEKISAQALSRCDRAGAIEQVRSVPIETK